MKRFHKIISFFNKAQLFIAGVFLAAMVILACTNITMRYLFNRPIKGTYELMGFFGAVTTALALSVTQSRKENIAVDILVNMFPTWLRRVLTVISHLICMLFFGMAAWQVGRYATKLMRSGEITETLRIVFYPFTYAVAFGCAGLAVVLFSDFLSELFSYKGEKGTKK